MQDPEIQELAKAGLYKAQQLAEYKQKFLESRRQFDSVKYQLAKTAKVREVTKAEEKELANLRRVYNHHRNIWNRVRQDKPAKYRVNRPKKSLDDLLASPELHEIAQSSGYSVEELAEAKRRHLNAYNAARSFQNKLSQVKKIRQVTDDEAAQLQSLSAAAVREKHAFSRMIKSPDAEVGVGVPRKRLADFMQDAEVQRIAQSSGYSLEEVAVQKRGFLDAKYEYREAQRLISAIKEERRSLTREEEEQFTKIDDAYHLQKTEWDRMSKGGRVDPAIPPPPKLGQLGKDVAALRPKAEVGEMAHPVTHNAQHQVANTPQQIAMYDQQHLDALDESPAFQEKISAVQRSMTNEEEDQLKYLRDVYNQQRAEWDSFRRSRSVGGPSQDVRSITYTAEQIAAYNRARLDALSKLRAFRTKMAAAGHPPTADDETQLRALREDYNEKTKIWDRARIGKPVDQRFYKHRPGWVPKSARSREAPPGSQAPSSQTEADPWTNPPLQMVAHRLLAPVLSSASHFLHGLGRQWRALPWTRYLAHPRVNTVKPAELLRAEPAL
ncbi:MAG: hypothetical protein M1826_006754 [Phylliscum demangeonii]|nr:MAG: hypothetical protein M1826_006754 [Phylliscum demangeonii]